MPDIPVLHLRHKCTYVVRTTTYGTYLSLLHNPWVETGKSISTLLMHFYELFGHGTRGQFLYGVCFSYLMPRLPSSHLMNLNDRRLHDIFLVLLCLGIKTLRTAKPLKTSLLKTIMRLTIGDTKGSGMEVFSRANEQHLRCYYRSRFDLQDQFLSFCSKPVNNRRKSPPL